MTDPAGHEPDPASAPDPLSLRKNTPDSPPSEWSAVPGSSSPHGQPGYPPPAYPPPTHSELGYSTSNYPQPNYPHPNYPPPGYTQPGYAQPGQAGGGYGPPAGAYAPAGYAPAGYVGADPSAPYGRDPLTGQPMSPKSKIVAGLLQFFLGWLGVGRFYMGSSAIGACQLALFVLAFPLLFFYLLGVLVWLGVAIWAFIDAIVILAGNPRDEHGFLLRS